MAQKGILVPKKPEILESKILAKSRLFKIEGMHLRFSNGEERHFERIHGWAHGSVMIVPMLDDKTILLIREYAAGVGEYILGFPKGAIDPDEDLLITANRELKEEVGYGANDIIPISKFSASPGYFTSVMQLVIAKDLYPEKLEGDEPEPIEVVPWSLEKVDELLEHPEFYEARSMAALLLIQQRFLRS